MIDILMNVECIPAFKYKNMLAKSVVQYKTEYENWKLATDTNCFK